MSTNYPKQHNALLSRLSPLELMLIAWSLDHWPEPADSIADKWGNSEWAHKCCGSIFRRVVKLHPAWLWQVVDTTPDQLLRLAPYVKAISYADLGYPTTWGSIPGRAGWPAWVAAARQAAQVDPSAWDGWMVTESRIVPEKLPERPERAVKRIPEPASNMMFSALA